MQWVLNKQLSMAKFWYHHGKVSSASRLDYATAAAVVLTQDGHENKIYELAGDTSYTLDDVAKWTSEITKKM